MAIATRVVGDGGISATGTLVAMSAECGGAATRDGLQHFQMLPGDPVAAAFDERLSRSADDIGHLQERPTHLRLQLYLEFLFSWGQHQCIQRAGGGTEMTL